MKLWLISRPNCGGYDTYDSAVVAAPDDMAARLIHPGQCIGEDLYEPQTDYEPWSTWVPIDQVVVEYVGEGDHEAGTVLCASFNAG